MNGNTNPEKEVDSMFKHEKMLFHPVAVEKPNRSMPHFYRSSSAEQTVN
jgi:hypothetical protein